MAYSNGEKFSLFQDRPWSPDFGLTRSLAALEEPKSDDPKPESGDVPNEVSDMIARLLLDDPPEEEEIPNFDQSAPDSPSFGGSGSLNFGRSFSSVGLSPESPDVASPQPRPGLSRFDPIGTQLTNSVVQHLPPSKISRAPALNRGSVFDGRRPTSDGLTSPSDESEGGDAGNRRGGRLYRNFMEDCIFPGPARPPSGRVATSYRSASRDHRSYLENLMHLRPFLNQYWPEDGFDFGDIDPFFQSSSPSLGLEQSLLRTRYVQPPQDPNALESLARAHRAAATVYQPTCTWSGELPAKRYRNPSYSCKVFLGGVPWDITERGLLDTFRPYGPIKIDWPGKGTAPNPPKGYAYILFSDESGVKALLNECCYDYENRGSWYYKISSRRAVDKDVQVIPWALGDSNFVRTPSPNLDPSKTVFVGALHGMLTAEGLAHIMESLFGEVVYAGIDTDRFKYPIGSGRVTFNHSHSYEKAVRAAFVEIKTTKFSKRVQVDPYLQDANCSRCSKPGPYFCRNFSCFQYYCSSCWAWYHNTPSTRNHKPLSRKSKFNQVDPTAHTLDMMMDYRLPSDSSDIWKY